MIKEFFLKRAIQKERKRFPIPDHRFPIEEIFVKNFLPEFSETKKKSAALLLWSFIRTYKPTLFIGVGEKKAFSPLIRDALNKNQNEAEFIEMTLDQTTMESRSQSAAIFFEEEIQKDWFTIVKRMITSFPNVQFLAFEGCQKHIECLNTRRAQVINFYDKYFLKKNFHLLIQSDEFSKKYNKQDENNNSKIAIIYRTYLKENEGEKPCKS